MSLCEICETAEAAAAAEGGSLCNKCGDAMEHILALFPEYPEDERWEVVVSLLASISGAPGATERAWAAFLQG